MSVTPLPAGRILGAAMTLLVERRSALMHALALPWLVHLALDAWALLAEEAAMAAMPAVLLLRLVVYVLLAVNVHRLILLGPQAVPTFGIGPFALRELRYLSWSCAQVLAAALVVMACAPLVALNPFIGFTVALVAAAWLVGRIALVLPEIALGRPLDLAASWALGRGAGFALALIVVGVPLLATLLLFPLAASGLLLLQAVAVTGSLLSVTLAVAGLSLAWRQLAGQRQPGAEGSMPADLDPRPIAARPIAARPIAARPIAARPIAARPDAARGLLELDVVGPAAQADTEDLAAYRGRLRGLVLSLSGPPWAAPESVGEALDALFDGTDVVRVHRPHIERVAVLVAGDDPGLTDALEGAIGRHFPDVRVRRLDPGAEEEARAWSAGEA